MKWNNTAGEVTEVTDAEGNVRYVNANDFAYGILRTLNPATASAYAYVLHVVEGAAEYNTGETDDPETVGVKVIDEQTLEVAFLEPAAYNATIMGMWVSMAEPQWLIEERGDRWIEPGFIQSYGPYTLKEWVHDSFATIIKNPFWPGIDSAPVPQIEEVTWNFLDEVPAFAEYEAGSMDVTRVPLADMDRVKADPALSEELYIAPSLCTYYYGFNTKAPFVEDVRVRRALSLAVDRESLVENVTKGGQEPAGWFSRPGLAGAPTRESHPDLGVSYDPDQAQAIFQEYLDETGQSPEDIEITIMFNTSSGHQAIAEAIQAMWKDVLGINVQLTNQEWKVFLKTKLSEDSPQVFRSGWCQDYPDANCFIDDVYRYGGYENNDGGTNWGLHEDFEQYVADAAVETDPEKRVELYAQAEKLIVWDDPVQIPIYWYTTVSVTKPWITRTYSVLGLQQHVEKWKVDMDAKMAAH